MFRVGAHVSISGGVTKAIERQTDLGGTCGQIFVGSPRGWAVSEIEDTAAESFKTESLEADIGPWIVHGTYLINFATPKDDLGERSVETVQAEIDSAANLGIPYYVFHPGAHTGAGLDTGVENVAERLGELSIPDEVTILLENTAGKGTTVGKRFEDLERMMALSEVDRDALGICLDSCHLFAAGYSFSDEDDIEALVKDIEGSFGLEAVEYLHLNDSKHPFGSEKDEHEHIGDGEIGTEGFQTLINHEAFRELPMVLETPVDDEKGYAWNIEQLRSLRTTE